jgi:hypothetical protein
VSILHGSDLRCAIALAVKHRSADQGEQKFGRCTLVALDAPKISFIRVPPRLVLYVPNFFGMEHNSIEVISFETLTVAQLVRNVSFPVCRTEGSLS